MEWATQLRTTLALADWGRGKQVLVVVHDPTQGALLDAELHAMGRRYLVCSGATVLLGVPPRSTVVLALIPSELGWLNANRPLLEERALVVMCVASPEVAEVMGREAPDLFSWMAARIDLPEGPQVFQRLAAVVAGFNRDAAYHLAHAFSLVLSAALTHAEDPPTLPGGTAFLMLTNLVTAASHQPPEQIEDFVEALAPLLPAAWVHRTGTSVLFLLMQLGANAVIDLVLRLFHRVQHPEAPPGTPAQFSVNPDQWPPPPQSTELLLPAEVAVLRQALLDAGLASEETQARLQAHLPPALAASLPRLGEPDRLDRCLKELNQPEWILGGRPALSWWLEAVEALVGGDQRPVIAALRARVGGQSE
jgi:hypothetical protein